MRQWGNTFGAGEYVKRDLRIYNDLPDNSPINAKWEPEINGQIVQSDSKTFSVKPGGFEP